MQGARSSGPDASNGPLASPCLIVAAHPDDETLGAAAVLLRTRPCFIVHVTDGAPRDAALRSCGIKSREAYAEARGQELGAALAIAGVAPESVRWLGATDQEACFVLGELTRRLLGVLEKLRPASVI